MEVVLKKNWQDLVVNGGLRPNMMLSYSNGIVTGMALRTKIFEGEFIWPAIAPGATMAFQLAEVAVTAAGLEDIFNVDKANNLSDRTSRAVILLEALRGESETAARYFKRMPVNQMQAIHPNRDIGTIRPELDQILGWDYVGYESPFQNPTAVSRVIMAEKQSVEIGIRNPGTLNIRNTSRVIFNTILFKPFNPEDARDLDKLVGIIRGRIPKLEWSAGLGPTDINSFPESFGVKAVMYDARDITLDGAVIG